VKKDPLFSSFGNDVGIINEELDLLKDSWRVFRVVSELVDGYERLTHLGMPSVSVFGSARIAADSKEYEFAKLTTKQIAKRGFAIVTGGGPGVMEAANKGAQEAGVPSCGLCIDLPFEKSANPYVDPHLALRFRYFFVRKVMFMRYTHALVVLPGGFGTLDEMFEGLTLIQTHKMRPRPIYIMGVDYWKGLFDWIKETAYKKYGTIKKDDLELIKLTDDPDEVADGIKKHTESVSEHQNF
jgi:uncharacterized protein (TIGR00730 family)